MHLFWMWGVVMRGFVCVQYTPFVRLWIFMWAYVFGLCLVHLLGFWDQYKLYVSAYSCGIFYAVTVSKSFYRGVS